ncbi:MAG: NTP transferase domain-containing protein [Candidatus Bathyarchaeia archaeon]
MALAALVMAGGRATRMHKCEKPLLQIDDKTMIEYVIEALRKSEFIARIVVAVTRSTPETARKVIELGIEVTETLGQGYESDMKQAIKTLGLGDVVVLSADLPFLTPEVLNAAIKRYLVMKKPALMVAAPIELYERSRLTPSYVFEVNSRKLVPIGVNVINGKMIDEPELEEEVFITEVENLVFNVNTPVELEIARRRSGKS